MNNNIDKNTIRVFNKNTQADKRTIAVRNASFRNDLQEISMDWEYFRQLDHNFSNIVSGEMPTTNQKSSGRCWGFAGLNLFRIYLGRKYNLKDFQFSQSFFMFWDKLEKSNYFLESIINTADKHWNSRLVMYLLNAPIQDGGQWDMWVNLVNKYGVVPQSEMPESFSSSRSMRMNRMITRKLRENAIILRGLKNKDASFDDINNEKNQMLEQIYKMLVIHLGNPPNSFDWQTRDKKKNFLRFENLDPNSFYNEHIGLKLDDYVCLINCPMSDKEYNKVYTVNYLGNVIEGNSIRYLNVESEDMKRATINSLKDDQPVWFGCDVSKHFHRDLGVMDIDLFDYDSFYDLKFGMDKASRLEYGDSQMTHAMLFTGVDLDTKDNPRKWRVENSWGNKGGDKGYHIMTDKWFDEYNYEVVVHKDHIPQKLLDLYLKEEPIHLDPWDPMGALAK
ncbi:MAG: aminopeptidase [Candidatus Marinimicrobia bacterium]|nr:aminopeptidase [Candidatus Neomarinimicrobiota bacterium]|tara:strand:+ start:134 stop:1477 length:1344 start_codon:yes stop_codon:yes gene_type:complete